MFVRQEAARLSRPNDCLATPKGKGISRQVPRLNQPVEQAVKNRKCLALALPVQRLGERTPVGRGPGCLLGDLHDPAVGRLWVSKEALVCEEVLMGQIGQGLTVLVHAPEQQPFRLLAVAGQRGRGIPVAREPGQNRSTVVIGCDLG